MSKVQFSVIALFIILFATLYFGVPTRPKERSQIDKERAVAATTITLKKLLLRARPTMSSEQLTMIDGLEVELEKTTERTARAEGLKQLSSAWNKSGHFAVGGAYAEEVAKLLETDSAWSIVGTTYYSAFQTERDSAIREFSISKAIEAFENAISLDPTNSTHRLNLGLCYVNGSGEPMKGILMIRDLAEKDSTNTSALLTLGRLSMSTGQYANAIKRLEAVVKLEDEQAEAHYLLGKAYQAIGNTPIAITYFEQAMERTEDESLRREIDRTLKTLTIRN